MLGSRYYELLDSAVYIPREVRYIQGFSFVKRKKIEIASGNLGVADIEPWLFERDAFAPNSSSGSPVAGFRLLLALGTIGEGGFGHTIPYTRPTFENIMRKFNLSKLAFEVVACNRSGAFATYRQPGSWLPNTLIQTPDLGLGGAATVIMLLVSHNKDTNITTGIFHCHYEWSMVRFSQLVTSNPSLADSCLYLPVLCTMMYHELLENHRKQMNSATAALGGTMGWQGEEAKKMQDLPDDPFSTIREINNLVHDVACNTQRSAYSIRLCSFLLTKLSCEDMNVDSNRLLKESMEMLKLMFVGCLETFESLGQRVNARNTMLYSTVSQNDSRLNYQIAKAARMDSYDMRAIALLTTFFLPGTFVASFFSCGVFSFNGSKTLTLKDPVWAYWGITIPLTLTVVGAWQLWSRMHRRRDHARDINAMVPEIQEKEKIF